MTTESNIVKEVPLCETNLPRSYLEHNELINLKRMLQKHTEICSPRTRVNGQNMYALGLSTHIIL